MNIKESISQNTNVLMNTGIVISLISAMIVGLIPKYEVISLLIYAACAIALVGWVLIVFNQFVLGAILLCFGSIFFLPLGAISMVGVFKERNERKVNKFIQQEYGSDQKL